MALVAFIFSWRNKVESLKISLFRGQYEAEEDSIFSFQINQKELAFALHEN
jgi:hypothetical protein